MDQLTRAEAMRRGLCVGCKLFVAPGNGLALQACGNSDDDKCPGPQTQPRKERKEKGK